MTTELHSARWLLLLGGVLAVLRLELSWLDPIAVDLVQGGGIVLLASAGLVVRRVTTPGPVDTVTGIAVTLLGLAVVFHLAGMAGHPAEMLTAPSWALGVLLTFWAAARALDVAGEADAQVWSLAFVVGLLVWPPVAILFGRAMWASLVTGVDGVEIGVEGTEGLLVFAVMLAPFLVLLGSRSTRATDAEVPA